MRTTVIGRIQCHLGAKCRIPSRLPDRNSKLPRTAFSVTSISPNRYHRSMRHSKRKTMISKWQVESLMRIHFSDRLMAVTPLISTFLTTELDNQFSC